MREHPIPRVPNTEAITDWDEWRRVDAAFLDVINAGMEPLESFGYPAREMTTAPIDFSLFTGVGSRKLLSYSPRQRSEEESDERFEIIYREVREQIRREKEEMESRLDDD